MSIYEFESNHDISDAVFKTQLDISRPGNRRIIDNGYGYPLLSDFALNLLVMVLEDVGKTRIKAMLDADKLNFHPASLSSWILC